MSLEKVHLDNGLTIYNDQIPGARVNNVSIHVPYGSIHEQEGDEGMAHVFEHCVYLETDEHPDLTSLECDANKIGMYINADTFYTRTAYHANGLDLEPNIRHLSQIMQHTHFPEKAVEHELKAVRREARTCLDDADAMHDLAAMSALYNKPYGRSVIGYHDKLDFDADDLKKLHKKYYKLGRMSLVVSGMAKMEDIIRLSEQYFEEDKKPYKDKETLVPVEFGAYHTTGLIRNDDTSVRLSMMYPLTEKMRDTYIDNMIAYEVAISAMRTTAFQTLRNKKGISYDGSIVSGTENHPDAWYISGDVTTDGEDVTTAIETFNDIFSRESKSYDLDDIKGALARYQYSCYSSLMSPESRVDAHIDALSSYLEPCDIKKSIKALKKTTVKQVLNAIDTLAQYTSESNSYTHITGARDAIGEVEYIIDRSEFA